MQPTSALYVLLVLGAVGALAAFFDCYADHGFTAHCVQVGLGAAVAYLAPSPIRYDRSSITNGNHHGSHN
jgi:hypothetical protein